MGMKESVEFRSSYAASFARDGFAVIPNVLSLEDVVEIRAAIDRIPVGEAVRKRKNIYGVRNLLETSPEICQLATRPEIWRHVTPVLGEAAFACRAIFFNKTPDANWVLGYHQDSVISVAEKIDTPGFLAWGKKAGIWQVQPPPEILAGMLALRIHLDDCGSNSGALRVLPSSHCHGWVEDQLADWKRQVREVVCTVPVGGVIAMCPLILHASSKAAIPSNRRVIHIEYANTELPNGLRWSRRIRPI